MPGSYLLDTNVAIAFLNGERQVTERIASADAAFLSAISFGELYYGAAKSTHPAENERRVNQLADQVAVLDCNFETAQFYGRVKSDLRSKGRPIPDNDLWIAALAIQHGLTLLTRDRHFQAIAALQCGIV